MLFRSGDEWAGSTNYVPRVYGVVRLAILLTQVAASLPLVCRTPAYSCPVASTWWWLRLHTHAQWQLLYSTLTLHTQDYGSDLFLVQFTDSKSLIPRAQPCVSPALRFTTPPLPLL